MKIQTDLIDFRNFRKKQKPKTIKDKSVMIPYFCSIHYLYFWRNRKKKYGKCGFCSTFNKKFHIPLFLRDYKKGGNNMVEVKQSFIIDDGTYSGTIVNVSERTEPYEYTDFHIETETEEGKAELTYGCPTRISVDKEGNPTTALAKTLRKFGMKLKIGEDISLSAIKKTVVGNTVMVVKHAYGLLTN